MSDGMGRELIVYLSSHATNRYFIPNWGILYLFCCLKWRVKTFEIEVTGFLKKGLIFYSIQFSDLISVPFVGMFPRNSDTPSCNQTSPFSWALKICEYESSGQNAATFLKDSSSKENKKIKIFWFAHYLHYLCNNIKNRPCTDGAKPMGRFAWNGQRQ